MKLPTATGCLLGLLASGSGAPAAERTLVELLNRAGAYVAAYEESFGMVVADEVYVQRRRVTRSGPIHETRILRSDVVLVRAPGAALPWWLLRDVYQVDGRAVRDRQARLERLLLGDLEGGMARARAIADEGARFNLGRSVRNFNVPTLALAFLHPALQPRFAFEWKGEATIEGRLCVEIAFRELGSPTVIRGPAAHPDVPASGRVFIHDGTDGTIGRTELALEARGDGVTTRTLLTTEYRALPTLALWVPVEMRDLLQTELVGERGRSGGVELVEGEARYSGFRKAGVTTEEEFRVPEEEKPQDRR